MAAARAGERLGRAWGEDPGAAEGLRVSRNEREFLLAALRRDGRRVDGRAPLESRPAEVRAAAGPENFAVEVLLGHTRAVAEVKASLVRPFEDRPNEGMFNVFVELGPMASPAFEVGRPGPAALGLNRFLERMLRERHALEMESLCVLAGQKVWSLRLDIHVLDHGGNLHDACTLAGLAALLSFRLQEAVVENRETRPTVALRPFHTHDGSKLTIHRLPLSVAFAVLEGGNLVVLDPLMEEEAVMDSLLVFTVDNTQQISCHLSGSSGLEIEQIAHYAKLAAQRAEELLAHAKRAVEAIEQERLRARVRRHQGPTGAGPSAGNGHVIPAEALRVAGGAEGREAMDVETALLEQAVGANVSSSESEDASSEGGGGAAEEPAAGPADGTEAMATDRPRAGAPPPPERAGGAANGGAAASPSRAAPGPGQASSGAGLADLPVGDPDDLSAAVKRRPGKQKKGKKEKKR